MNAGPLGQQQKASDDKDSDDQGGNGPAQCHSAVAYGLVEEIADGGAKRSRQDKSSPEQKDPRDICPVIGHGQHGQTGGKERVRHVRTRVFRRGDTRQLDTLLSAAQ